MLLVLFIIFGLQHQIRCNSAFKYFQDNSTFLNALRNEVRVNNDEVASGAKSNAKGPALGAGKEGPVSRKNILTDASYKPRTAAPPPPAAPAAPLSPVFSNRLKLSRHKPRERAYQEPEESPAPSPPPPPPAERNLSRLLPLEEPGGLLERLRLQARLPAPGGPHMRADGALPPAVIAFGSSKEEDREAALSAPDANLLDMAQAVGGHLPSLRYKNRLCARHVLVPEGPKYDSRGAVYLPAYSPRPPRAGGSPHDYAVTRAPRLLLPKCCNCCKKSVLGCE